MEQEMVFKVEAERAVRRNPGAGRHAERQIEIRIGAVSGDASRAIRQVTNTQTGIWRHPPFLTDEILADQAAGFRIPVPVAALAAR
jgi:hypothetical protein